MISPCKSFNTRIVALCQFKPPFIFRALYDNTCQLREKRLDIEEALTEEKKNSEALRKENEALAKKAKVIDSALKTAHNDLEAFQVNKATSNEKNKKKRKKEERLYLKLS